MKKILFLGCLMLMLGISVRPSNLTAQTAEDLFIYPEYSKKVSMDFKNADLNDVLKIFSQQSGMNFIASQEVTNKKITLYLDQVPVEEALERILTANSLTYEILPGSNIFVVKNLVESPNLMTRIYYLKNATVQSSKFNDTIEIKKVSDDDTDSETNQESATDEPKFGIIAAVKAVLTTAGSVTEDPRTNSLIVKDIPAQFPIIEKTIARLDVPVPQIVIEVEMLDVSKVTADKLGVKFGEQPLTFTGGQRNVLYPFNQNDILASDRFAFDSDNPEFRVGTISAAGLTAALQFLKTQTDTKNLARPRILTLNNETAEIRISTNEAIGLQTSTDATEGVSTQTIQAERVQTGVFLNVTPQVNSLTGEITMAIAPKVIQARTGATFQGQSFKDPEERGTKSILRVYDGETIVVGGLLRTDDTNTRTKVPFLGDIPLLGGAFRHKDKAGTERELIIFITPRIVPDTNVAKKEPLPDPKDIVREQDPIPASRNKAIEEELRAVEKKRL